jgi:hypothetical protein
MERFNMSYKKEDYKAAFTDLYYWIKEFVIMCAIVLAIVTAFFAIGGAFIYCIVHYFAQSLCVLAILFFGIKFWAVLDAARAERQRVESKEADKGIKNRQMDLFDDN